MQKGDVAMRTLTAMAGLLAQYCVAKRVFGVLANIDVRLIEV